MLDSGNPAMARLRLILFGGIQIHLPAGQVARLPARKAQALLAYLAVRPGQPHSRDKLAALLWSDAPAERARHSLRQALVAIRQALGQPGAPVMLERGDTVALDPSAIETDVGQFEELSRQSTSEALEQAVALYHGDFLEGLGGQEEPFEEWLMPERERLRELALEALSRLFAAQSKADALEPAVRTANRLLALDPGQEAAHRALMRLYARHGRRGAALVQYQVCVAALQRELGLPPDGETRALYQEILRSRAAEVVSADRDAREDGASHPAPSLVGEPREDAPPLVGRERELTELRRARDESWRSHGRVAVVLGEEGIGKSRLVAEVVGESVSAGGRVLLGRAHETSQILPFGPWVDALRRGDVLREIQGAAGLEDAWRGELARLFPELGTEATDLPPGEASARLFEAMAQLLRHMTARQRLVLVLEDLHWADEMSLRLLAFLSRRVMDWPVLLLVTAREEDVAVVPVLRTALSELDRDRHLVLTLPALSKAETLALVQALATAGGQGAATRLGDRIWSASEGNPFVVVETMRALHEGGPVAASQLTLPQRARDTISGRLDRLGDRARELAAVASVIGSEFDFTLLQHAAGLGPHETAEGVEELVARRILHVVGEGFDFIHDSIRQVAYERLLAPRRQLLHGTVAEALEAFHEPHLEAVEDQLAFHYGRAARADKAVLYLARVADRAAHAYAHGHAVATLGEACGHAARLPAAERDRQALTLLLRQAFSLSILGRFREILDLLLPERERVERLHEPTLAGPYFFRIGMTHTYFGALDLAAENAQRALAEAAACGDDSTRGQAYYLLTLAGYYSGQSVEGVQHGLRAIELLKRPQDAHWLGLAHALLGINHLVLGEFDRALAAEAAVDAIGEAMGDARLRSMAGWMSGWAHATRGEHEAGIAACRRSVAVSPDPVNTALASGRLGYAHVEKGDPDPAIPLLEQAVEHLGQFRFRATQGNYIIFLGEAHLLRGELDRARALVSRGLEMVREARFPHGIGWAQRALGRIARAGGALDAAGEHLDAALETFSSIQAGFEVARTEMELAELAGARGDLPRAAAALADAHRRFVSHEAPVYVTRVRDLAARLEVSLISS